MHINRFLYIFWGCLLMIVLTACTSMSTAKPATATILESSTKTTTPVAGLKATRQASITPLPTRATPTVWPPYSPGLDWPVYEIETLEISIQLPPGWQQTGENEFKGEDGSLKVSSREIGFQGVDVFCTLEANQNSLVPENPQLSLWNSGNGFYGCAILLDGTTNDAEKGLIFAWYPQAANMSSVLEIEVTPELAMAIENSLKFTGKLPTNQPLLYFAPTECILNQDPPSKTV